MSEESRDGRVCPKCDETIFRDECACNEENMKLYQKLVSDDLRAEADLIKQGEMEAQLEIWFDTSYQWYQMNGWQFVQAQSRLAKAGAR